MLDTRRMILQSAGYMVVTAHSTKEAFHLFVIGDFDLVLLCHTIPKSDRDGLTCMIRAYALKAPVVAVATVAGQQDFFATATLENDPYKLLCGIQAVLSEAASSAMFRIRERVRSKAAQNTVKFLSKADVFEHLMFCSRHSGTAPGSVKSAGAKKTGLWRCFPPGF
ncbi:MAG: hypothetical protein QOE55_8154 [Acidobacteriaceae bacterium]|nr:hypothetical protein [Acidobacteriaceae bacterium]